MSKFMPWQLIAPPATRFFQMADGNFSLYFEKERIGEMVKWAESQLEAFQRLEIMLQQQAKKEEEAELAKHQKAEELKARAKNVSPGAPKGHIPNIPTAEGRAKAVEAKKPLPKGAKPAKPTIGGVPVVTQAEVNAAVPTLPKPKVEKNLDLLNDPGMKIALAQAAALEAQQGITRDENGDKILPEEPEEEGDDVEEVPDIEDIRMTDAPPTSEDEEEKIPPTERPGEQVADDDRPY